MNVLTKLIKASIHKGRAFGPKIGIAFFFRAQRNFMYFHLNRRLWALSVCREFKNAGEHENFLHHLSTKKYLNGFFSIRQRIAHAFMHFSIDGQLFNAHYKNTIYRGEALELWARDVGGVNFVMHLSRGSTNIPEGELTVYLLANNERLHSISFSWVQSKSPAGLMEICPYITRNQGRWRKDTEPLNNFNEAFPQNSPSYFCYSALQGIARAMSSSRIMAIRAQEQCCYDPKDVKSFANSYDEFWNILGGSDSHQLGFEIPVPFSIKPLSEVSSKHRKRALTRRAYWHEIETSARAKLNGHRIYEI